MPFHYIKKPSHCAKVYTSKHYILFIIEHTVFKKFSVFQNHKMKVKHDTIDVRVYEQQAITQKTK